MLVLGIDPGTAIMGYGLILVKGNRHSLVEYGCIRTASDSSLEVRLQKIYQELTAIILQHKPDYFAIEELFFNKNVRTALAVGHARGVALLAAANAGLTAYEYTPLQVKQAVVGYGRAEKAQVQFMVKTLLNLEAIPKPDDAADALAIALCHAQSIHSLKYNLILGEQKK